jgi:hypothetical protein
MQCTIILSAYLPHPMRLPASQLVASSAMVSSETIFQYTIGALFLPIIVALAALLVGIIARRQGMHQRVQFGLFFFAALVGLGIFPGMLTARVSVP